MCSGYTQVFRPLPQQSSSADTWASVTEPWKKESAFKNQQINACKDAV